MKSYEQNPISYGIELETWMTDLKSLFNEKGMVELPEISVLSELYKSDRSAYEVYLMVRTRRATSAVINISWFDEFGQESVAFSNSDSIRHFYELNPRIREVMKTKVHRNYNSK